MTTDRSRRSIRESPEGPAPQRIAAPALVALSGIMLFDGTSMRPVGFDDGATQILGVPGTDGTTIPVEILSIIRNRAPEDTSCLTAHFVFGGIKYLSRSYMVSLNGYGPSQLLVVCIECRTNETMTDPIAPLVAEYGLTLREQETLRGIALGLSTKELAHRMNISPNTVRAFVRLIMIKLGVTTRGAILGRLLEHLMRPPGMSIPEFNSQNLARGHGTGAD